jgi:predicted ATPase
VLDDALGIAATGNDCCHEAELHRLKGECARNGGDQPEVVGEHFRGAIQTARKQQSKAWELRATISLARLYQEAGRRHEAIEALRGAYECFTEGFSTPDLHEANSLLHELQSV